MEFLGNSEHLEMTVLGAMMLDSLALSDGLAALKQPQFALDSHRTIFRAMEALQESDQHIDTSTVCNWLRTHAKMDSVGGIAYVYSLTEGVPRNFNVDSYCKTIKAKALLRELKQIGADIEQRASDPAEDAITLLSDIEQRLAGIADSSIQKGLSGIAEIVSNGFEIDQVYTEGLKTHFLDFDRMTHGLQNSELIIIAARPSMGKTALAINIAQNAAVRDDKVVAVFSLEMSKEALLRRMLAGSMSRASSLERLMGTEIFIDDTPGISLQEMRAKSRRLKQQEGLDLIVVDYLQLMTAKGENRTQEVSALSRGLKGLAKELQVPLVALSQLSRANEQRTGDKRPRLSDLRESGSIEQDADVVCFIHREEYYDRDNAEVQGKAEIIIAKQRNGPTGTVDLAWIAEQTRFENLGGRHV